MYIKWNMSRSIIGISQNITFKNVNKRKHFLLFEHEDTCLKSEGLNVIVIGNRISPLNKCPMQ